MKFSLLITSLLLAFVMVGAGCAKKPEQPSPQPQQQAAAEKQKPAPQQTETNGTWVHPSYEFSFSLPLGTSSKFPGANPDSVDFVDPATQKSYAVMAIQEGIPGIPLVENLIEGVMVDGVKGHIYHDTDAQTGTQKIDKLMVIMPGTVKTVYIAVPVENMDNFDLKDAVKTWKWKK